VGCWVGGLKLVSAAVHVYWADMLGLSGQVDLHVYGTKGIMLGNAVTIPHAAAARLA